MGNHQVFPCLHKYCKHEEEIFTLLDIYIFLKWLFDMPQPHVSKSRKHAVVFFKCQYIEKDKAYFRHTIPQMGQSKAADY